MVTKVPRVLLAFAAFWMGTFLLDNTTAAQTKRGDQLTPERVIALALSRNPSLAEMAEAVIAASARVEPAGILDDPTVSYALAPATTTNSSVNTGQRIEISQSLPWPGKLAAQEEAARQRAMAARESRAQQRLEVVTAAKAAFAEWYFVHQALRLNRENRQLLEDLRASADARFAGGRGLQQDVLQAEVAIARLEERRLHLQQERNAVKARLNTLMNEAPDNTLPPPSTLPPPQALPPLRALIERASVNHPKLRILEHQVAEQSADARLAKKEFYPDVRISGGYNSLWEAPEKRWTLGVSINIPFNQSQRQAKLDAARADRRRAGWRLADRRAELLEDVTRLYSEVERVSSTIELFRERLLPLSRNTFDVSVAEYESGAGNFLDVIEAERNKLEIENSALRAQADHYRARANLEFWVGGPLDAAAFQASQKQDQRGNR